MPRIYDVDNNPHDFCNECFPDELDFEDGVNNGYNADHPDYDDNPDIYKCEECEKQLTNLDN